MPRILPLLKKVLSQTIRNPNESPFESWNPNLGPRRQKVNYPPRLPRPSLHPSQYPQKSVLLSENAGVILESDKYKSHKSPPPLVEFTSKWKIREAKPTDKFREMTREERDWWANPWLRMLASPLRHCGLTSRSMPSDFMIRLASFSVNPPDSGSRTRMSHSTFLPDGLQHTQFSVRSSARGSYYLASRSAIDAVQKLGVWRRFASTMHPMIPDQIAHLLRLRVLQELELLHDALLDLAIDHRVSVGRWLNKIECDALKSSDDVAPNTIALLVTSPPTDDEIFDLSRAMDARPPPMEQLDVPQATNQPTALLSSSRSHDPELSNLIPAASTPVYDCPSLFPDRAQRKKLHDLLLSITRGFSVDPKEEDGSQVFVLVSSGENVRGKVDVAAVGIALWRLRMFEDVDPDNHVKEYTRRNNID